MYASFPTRHADTSSTIRWFARASGLVLMATWLAFFVTELMRPGFGFERNMYMQGAALAVVFGGYILGWSKEVPGGLLAIVGTIVYCSMGFVARFLATPETLCFAIPGVLYLLAHYFDRKRVTELKL